MGGKTSAVWDGDTWRWYSDAGGEGTNPLAAAGANPSGLNVGTDYRLRCLIQETAGSNQSETPVFELYYDVDTGGGFSGTFIPCDSDDTYFTAVTASPVTDHGTTTQQIGAGTFNDGEFVYGDATAGWPTNAMAATAGSDEYECEWVLNFAAAAAGVGFRFRVERDTGTDLDTYDGNGTTSYTEVTPVGFAPDADRFGFYEDGTEAGATLIGTENTNINRNDVTTGNEKVHLRLRVQESGGGAGATTDDYKLRYSKNSGAYADVTAASSNVQVDTASGLTDGGATTNRLTAGTGSFVAGEQEEVNGVVEDHQLTADNYTNHVFALELQTAKTWLV